MSTSTTACMSRRVYTPAHVELLINISKVPNGRLHGTLDIQGDSPFP